MLHSDDVETWTDEEAERYCTARNLILDQISVCSARDWIWCRQLLEHRLNDLDPRNQEVLQSSIDASTEWLDIFGHRQKGEE